MTAARDNLDRLREISEELGSPPKENGLHAVLPTLLERFLASLGIGIVVVDMQGTIVHWSRGYEQVINPWPDGALEDWPGQLDSYYIEDHDRLVEPEDLFSARILRGETIRKEERWMAPEGGAPYVMVASGFPVRDENGELIGGALMFQRKDSIEG